ncbi:MAG: hypothetical protein CME62_07385 [Halobacteriovoraceae bacterium]|nr:hypothetical protein [Halobacteriovoraceae bacterium]|tara:strand:+ start:36753 stop:37244 length:492 start_codon:yes stop_codon:yes gene_type:complete
MRFLLSQTLPSLFPLITLSVMLTGCNSDSASHLDKLKIRKLVLPSGVEIKTYIAKSHQEQKKGLSGVLPQDFSDKEAMLFPMDRMRARQFWMPNTHFNLDIIYLNKDMYVLEIHRNLAHFPKDGPDHLIPRSKTVFSQHVLELKASSPYAQEIQPGMILKFKD